MNVSIKIGIVENYEIVREGLISILKDSKTMKLSFGVSSGTELFVKLKSNQPDVILLGYDTLGNSDTFDKIKKQFPKIKIIIISTSFSEPAIMHLLKKGVNSFLHINCTSEILLSAIRSVYHQGVYFDNKISAMIAKELSAPSEFVEKVDFSEQDLNILKLICKGYTSKQIGDQLFLNNRTVEWHRSQMMKRLHIRNVSALILYAVQNKLVST